MKLNDQNLNEEMARVAALAGGAKPRRDQTLRVIELLGNAGADDLARRLVNGLPYSSAVQFILQKTGERVSTAAVCNFYQHHCRRRLLVGKGGPLNPGTRRYVIVLDVLADGRFEIMGFQPANDISQIGPDGRGRRRQKREDASR